VQQASPAGPQAPVAGQQAWPGPQSTVSSRTQPFCPQISQFWQMTGAEHVNEFGLQVEQAVSLCEHLPALGVQVPPEQTPHSPQANPSAFGTHCDPSPAHVSQEPQTSSSPATQRPLWQTPHWPQVEPFARGSQTPLWQIWQTPQSKSSVQQPSPGCRQSPLQQMRLPRQLDSHVSVLGLQASQPEQRSSSAWHRPSKQIPQSPPQPV